MNFDEVAKEWDTELRIERAKSIANKIKDTVKFGDAYSALEFGCGTGLISFNLYNLYNNITLIDNSKEMINVVNDKINQLNINNMKGICMDLFTEQPTDKSDVIYTSMALHHVIDVNGLSKQFYNILKHKGILCIVDLDEDGGSFHKKETDFKGHNGFSQQALKKVLEDNGFCNIESETFYKAKKKIDEMEIEYSLFIMVAEKE